MEKVGARRVLVNLRHPLARISSGINRRLERNQVSKGANALFVKQFGSHEAYVGALRNETDPLHRVALEVTSCQRCQNYMLPISEFYLSGSLGLAEIAFTCIDTLGDDYVAAFQRWWGINVSIPKNKRAHESKTTSKNATSVQSRFSEESIDWIERIYAADVALYKKPCPEGFRKYDRTTLR
mmetsp:Transcript_25971/g.40252  ORF Transcript_25971/g.40252 Transcript_25971/m.40252 type:complete len:182 (+) Transcript_25971:562-1107(+)